MAATVSTERWSSNAPVEASRGWHIRQTLIYVLLIIGGLIVIIPFVWMISTSLKSQDQLFVNTVDLIPHPAMPQNYIDLWAKLSSIAPGMTFLRIVGNTLFITLLSMFGEIFSSSIVAYGFARFNWKGRDTVFAIMLATVMIPSIITRIPGFLIWKQIGLLNTYDPMTWPALLAWGPINIFLIRQFFLTIPREIEEAAIIDGANIVQIYWYIMLPLVRPILLAIALFSFQGNWNNFQSPLLYLTTPQMYPLALSVQFFQNSVSKAAPLWQYMMAMSVMMSIPVLVIYFLAQKQFLDGINIGGVKG